MEAIVGTTNVRFDFLAGKTSTVTKTHPLDPPEHAELAYAMLVGFDVQYTDNDHYDFGALGVKVEAESIQMLSATVTLRDNHVDEREWEGSVEAIVFFLKSVDS